MNPNDLFHFLRDLLQNNAEVIAAFLTGCFLMAMMIFYLGRRWKGLNPELVILQDQLKSEQTKSDTFNELVKQKETTINALSRECETMQEDLLEAKQKHQRTEQQLKDTKNEFATFSKKARTLYYECKRQRDELRKQVVEVENLQGKIWEKPAHDPIPTFRPLAERQVPILAMFNLKGGVGKTSLTAHLGAAWWGQGKRILLVDLDYQASLTHLVLPVEQIDDLKPGGRFVDRLLLKRENLPAETWNLLAHIDQSRSSILPAHEDLARIEDLTQANWLIKAQLDPRFLFREALHHLRLTERFDYILLDCPPRLSLACINALTACDFVLVPTLFDKTSRDAVTRLLDLLKRLVAKKICPDLQVLGIIGNKAHRKARLTIREQGAWEQLKRLASDRWPVAFFQRHIPHLKAINEAAENRELADKREDLGSLFSDLAQEIDQEIKNRVVGHAQSTRSSAVS